MRVSFDFDDTLRTQLHEPNSVPMQLLNGHLVANDQVWIVTTRFDSVESVIEIFEFTDIPSEFIVFTNGQDKLPVLIELGIELHYEDDPIEIKEIQKAGILVCNCWTQKAKDDFYEFFGDLVVEF